MAEVDKDKGMTLWRLLTKLRCVRWHQWARLIAGLVLLDQWLGALGGIPASEAIVVVALGALFAPVPRGKGDE